ncbi:MAG: spore coat protein [Desulfitobacteriaceae bacterium]
MGWLDNLFGEDQSLTDKDIAMDMLKDSKFALCSMSMAITESSNPELRQELKKQFNDALQNHFNLADMAANKDWYKPHVSPQEMLDHDFQDSQAIVD